MVWDVAVAETQVDGVQEIVQVRILSVPVRLSLDLRAAPIQQRHELFERLVHGAIVCGTV